MIQCLIKPKISYKRKHDVAMLFIQADFERTVKTKRLAEKPTEVLFGWFFKNIENPYPDGGQKKRLAAKAKLSLMQVRNWFTNQRKRHWLPIKNKKRAPRTHFELLIARSLQGEKGAISELEMQQVVSEEGHRGGAL